MFYIKFKNKYFSYLFLAQVCSTVNFVDDIKSAMCFYSYINAYNMVKLINNIKRLPLCFFDIVKKE